MSETCMTCAFSRNWSKGPHWDTGDCRRHAPSPVSYAMLHKILFPELDPEKDAQLSRGDSVADWPCVVEEDWCGEWKQK